MNTVKVRVHAKLNLTLDVLGAAEGYHALDSLAVTVSLSDTVTARKREGVRVKMGGESVQSEFAERAAQRFAERFHTGGADIAVRKEIPVGAGMGGSSSDVAAVLLSMARLYEIADMGAVKSLADELGSDTGYLLQGGLARLRGRGELQTGYPMPAMYFLVLIPEARIPAAECFRLFDEAGTSYPPRTERALAELEKGNLDWAAKLFGNHLTEAAVKREPAIGRALCDLRALSPMCACMTGSGSACFALFPTRELAEWAKSRYRGDCRALVLESTQG